MRIGRRGFVGAGLAAALVGQRAAGAAFEANWSSLTGQYRVPEWFMHDRFGIWAHWGPQCVPEQGDWYGRQMYEPGNPMYDFHCNTYGHPSEAGFIELIQRWRAEHWDPDHLVARYKAAGARYFVAMAGHHDNFDMFNSRHHGWNATRVGPRKDIIGGWERAARKAGLKFGVSNHTSHAWHWFQTAYGYDPTGPRAGHRYDAWNLTAAQGKGQWWDGLDPQQLYAGATMAPPDGIADNAAMQAWHDAHSGRWMEFAPVANPGFVRQWLARQMDLVERYRPDLVYFDDTGVPFGPTGLEAVAHYYNAATQWHGSADVVLTGKLLTAYQRRAIVEDVERGYSDRIRPERWQTCTCIGDWHYNRARFLEKSYVPAERVIQRLVDTVAKNGNLLLSIPVRGDGTIDAEESRVLDGITRWMKVHGDVMIHGTQVWRRYGEGPTEVATAKMGEAQTGAFTPQDVRFVVKDGALFVAFLAWPDAPVMLGALGEGQVARATLVGGGPVRFDQNAQSLTLTLPPRPVGGIVPVVRLEGAGLV